MPGLSFTGDKIKRGPFWWQIITKVKIQTCRVPRKRPFVIDDPLMLYWQMRVSPRKALKPIHHLGDAVAQKVPFMQFFEFSTDDKFAQNDGFVNAREMQRWFGLFKQSNEIFQLIHWGDSLVLNKEAKEIIDRCEVHPDYPNYTAYVETIGVET